MSPRALTPAQQRVVDVLRAGGRLTWQFRYGYRLRDTRGLQVAAGVQPATVQRLCDAGLLRVSGGSGSAFLQYTLTPAAT